MAMVDGDFDRRSRAFWDWFRNFPGATVHPNIELRDVRDKNAGRGIVATSDIAPETVLFTVPRNAILCTATSEAATKMPELFNVDGDEESTLQDSWTTLILIMMYEFFLGESSRWKAYLDVLPTTFDTPMTWTPDDLRQLQASPVVSKIGKQEADRMIATKIVPAIRARATQFPGSATFADENLLKLAHRMGSTIMAFAFDLDRDEDEDEDEDEQDGWVEDRDGNVAMGMVPMADMLNADAVFNAHISHEDGRLTATALQRIHTGQEVLNYYGPLGNGELLRRYGYVTDAHARYDVVDLPWGLVETQMASRLGVKWQDLKKALQRVGADDQEDGFVLDWDSDELDPARQLTQDPLVFHALPDELFSQFQIVLRALQKIRPEVADRLADGDACEAFFLACVLGALEERESQYGTTLEEDGQLLRATTSGSRLHMAIRVRAGEKAILGDARRWAAGRLVALQRNAGLTDGGPATKRQRT